MNLRHLRYVLTVVLPFTSAAYAADIGTAFNYQGFLEKPAGTPVGSPTPVNCDFEFTLWNDDDLSAPENQIGPTLTFDGVNTGSGGEEVDVAVVGAIAFVSAAMICGLKGDSTWVTSTPHVVNRSLHEIRLLLTRSSGTLSPRRRGGKCQGYFWKTRRTWA